MVPGHEPATDETEIVGKSLGSSGGENDSLKEAFVGDEEDQAPVEAAEGAAAPLPAEETMDAENEKQDKYEVA